MNKIKKLIKELCPNGVEWKKLEEVCEIGTGNSNRQDATDNGQYPFFVRSKDVLKIDTFEYSEESIIIPGEGGIGDIFHYIKGKYALHQRAYRVHPISDKLCGKFLYYYLFANFKLYINSKAVNATVTSIRKPMLEGFPIPLPPLPIQTEIVRILDKFVEQQEQIERLIELRKKQYEYYREELLKPKEGEVWETKRLGEIGTFVRGNGLQKTDFREEGVGCIHYGQIYTYYGMFTNKTKSFVSPELASKLKKVEQGDIVLACTSENIEDVCMCVVWEGEETIVTGGHSSIYKHNENPRFIAYFLKSKAFEVQKIKYAYGAKVIDIKNDDLEKIYILLPSREKQDEIVESLNKFESYIESLSFALESSRRRYEYYRDEMLRF